MLKADQVDRAGQEEFIWAMRSRAYDTGGGEEETWRERRLTNLGVQPTRSLQSLVVGAHPEHFIKMIATMLPDELVADPSNNNDRIYDAAIVRGQFIGFEEVWDRYRTIGKGGPQCMTHVLNAYLGNIVQEALVYNGDVINFSGKSFLAIWKQGSGPMSDCVHQAIDYALSIIKSYSEYKTDVGVQISVKLAVSCGSVVFSPIGGPTRSLLIVTGKPLEDTNDILSHMSEGEVVTNLEAWCHLNSAEYISTVYDEDNDYYLIKDFSNAWRSIQQDVGDKNAAVNTGFSSYTSLTQISARREMHDIYECRPCIGDAINMSNYDDLKRYVFPPFVDMIEDYEPIEMLSEMRQLVIMAANYIVENETDKDFITSSDLFYRTILKIIEPLDGHVYRVFIKETEISFFVMFGVRGNKQEFECRNALQAARKCLKGAEACKILTCAAVSVVTGMVFSGPVGFHLRREYILIGAVIGKAVTLLQEFPNKVTCDRETLLQSQLETRHFVLQEFKQAQMISTFGPVYEYLEFDISSHLPRYTLSKYPLLDRDYELETFKAMLATCVPPKGERPQMARFRQRYEPTGLFLHGDTRSGRTRLLDELVSLTPKEMPMFRLRMNTTDLAVPYQTIYYIFGVPLGIVENSTRLDRETKVSAKLRQLPLGGLECVLNPVFRVDYPLTHAYRLLKSGEKHDVLKNLIKHLCRVCFARPWVIFIDGGEFIDYESWFLLYTVLETHLVLLIVTIDSSQEVAPIALDYMSRTKSKSLTLLPIDNRYHAGIACQILDCSAVPVEIEKILQDQSRGNPGWMQNFLLSLIHSNIIWLRKVASLTEYSHTLVIPAKAQLMRNPVAPHPQVDVESTMAVHPAVMLSKEKWDVFSTVAKIDDTTEESDEAEILDPAAGGLNFPGMAPPRETRESTAKRGFRSFMSGFDSLMTDDRLKTIEVCLLAVGGEEALKTFDMQSSKNFYVTKVMDSLSAIEVKFLKSASVIGPFFLRDMLQFIMKESNPRVVAITCQNLFEIGVIGCAEGDFRRSLMNYAPMWTNHYAQLSAMLIQCNCTGFVVNDECQDLPKYANCGFMRFKELDFMHCAYKMLTSGQLHDMHAKAMNFLEKRTKKCVSCGGGAFSKILGNRYEEGALAERKKQRDKARDGKKTSSNTLDDWEFLTRSSVITGGSRFSMASKRYQNKINKVDSGIVFTQYRKSGFFGEGSRIAPTFDQLDFTNCECAKILKCLYFYIRKHCEMTEHYDKWLYATLEYSVICTHEHNTALAIKSLSNAIEFLNGSYKNLVKHGECWKYNTMKARILTEMGRARSRLGQTTFAYVAYEEALQNYGLTLPKPLTIRYKFMTLRQFFMLATKSRRGIGCKYGYVAEFCDNVSACLNRMATLFVQLEMWDNAYIAAVWSLQKALQSEKNFITMIKAFSMLIYVSGRMKKHSALDTLETMALDYCRRYKGTIDINDMKTITGLYSAIFYIRVAKARFADALQIGITLDTLTDMLHLRDHLIRIFPLFFEILLIRDEINDVYNALRTFEAIVNMSDDYNGHMWFYSHAIYFHLQTGFTFLDITTCEEFYYAKNKQLINLREPEAERRYYVAIWLWYLRTENYEKADVWEMKLLADWTVEVHESLNNLFTTLMYIEGLILSVTFKMDRKVIFVIEQLNNKITALFNVVEMQSAKNKVIAPRLYHLKAYFCMCRMREYEAWECLSKSVKMSRASENVFDCAWAQHSERAWKQEMSAVEQSSWKDHAIHNNLGFRDMEANSYKTTLFTLELPLYV